MKSVLVLVLCCMSLAGHADNTLMHRQALNCMAQVLYKMKGGQDIVPKVVSHLEQYRKNNNAEELNLACKSFQKLKSVIYNTESIISNLLQSKTINIKTAQFVIAAISPYSICSNTTLAGSILSIGGSAQGEYCRSSNGQVWGAIINGGQFSLPPFHAAVTAQYRFYILKGVEYKKSTLVSAKIYDGGSGRTFSGLASVILGLSWRQGGIANECCQRQNYNFGKITRNINTYTQNNFDNLANNGKGIALGYGFYFESLTIEMHVRNIVDMPQITKYTNSFPYEIFNEGLDLALQNRWKKNVLNKYVTSF